MMAPRLPPLASYRDALAWLYAQTRGGLPRDPERTRLLLQHLALPMPRASLHVIGTTGKGTVTAMAAAALTAAGRRTGRFLSPHVEDFRERIAVDGVPIGEAEVLDFARRAAALRLDPAPAFFELTYAMALDHFARRGVDTAVVEAGVGARNDATITLDGVRCVVVTSVDRDHLDTLGPSLTDIARDKAEAVRPDIPTVTAATGEALEILAGVALARCSPLFVDAPHDPLFAPPAGLEHLEGSDPIRWRNARLATAALRLTGNCSETAILHGLLTPALPGRFEAFRLGGRRVVLDGAHNPSAARALRASLPGSYVLVFGALPRKLGEETLGELEPGALHTFVTRVDGQESELARTPGRIHVLEPLDALEQALAVCPPAGTVVVAGSLYLAGQLRPRLRALDEALRASVLP